MKPKLLIVDDDEEIRTQMKWALCQDYEIVLAEDRIGALEAFKSSGPSVTMLDLGLPPHPNDPEEGLAALSGLLALDSAAKIIIISGQEDKENARRAVGTGAYDFFCKPVEMEELKLLLRRCLYVAELEKEYREMQQSARGELFEDMIGGSPQMQAVFAFIRKVAATSAPVLLLGESGTGKEMAALAIHRRSLRKEGPFVAINCNAIPENLLESELFGHEKGAFTGAQMQRKGLIETASGGTLFLDEIGELPPPIQVKLLRFLQEKSFQRVGGRQEIQSDARVLAATNADLKQAIANGKFREDLYFRLAVVVISLPPLRERGDDVGLVAREFLQRFAVQNGRTSLTFAPETLRAVNRHSWPGNVRELQNRIQRAVIMADGKRITVNDMELTDAAGVLPPITLKEAREDLERDMIQRTLKAHAGKISSAAAELGISRPTFYELMEKLKITRESAARYNARALASDKSRCEEAGFSGFASNRSLITSKMISEEALILLSDNATPVWANTEAADILGCSPDDLHQLVVPAMCNGDGHSEPLAEAFRRILASEATGAAGRGRFLNKAERKIAVDWKMWALPSEGGQRQVLLAFSEAAQTSPENPVTSSYRDVFEYAVEGFFRSTADGRVLEVNPALATMYGYPNPAAFIEAVQDLNKQLYVRPNRRAEFVRIMQEQGFVAGFESEFYRLDGSIIWVAVFARAIRDEKRRLLFFEGSMIDITERKLAETALQRSEEKFRRLAETTRVVPFEFDVPTQMFSYVGPQAEVLFGQNFRTGLTFDGWASMLYPDDFEQGTRFAREAAFHSDRDFQTEFRAYAADGRIVWVRQIVHRDTTDDDRDHVRGFLFEITEAKKVEEERERSRGQIRELAARTQQVREEERMSIAREIHDELGQALTLLKIDLSWLNGRLTKTVAEDLRKPLEEKIGTMEQMIHWTLLTVRRILSALRPPLLDELGLKDAIEFQMEEFSQRVGIRYELDVAPVGTLPANSATAVFRIFQEALTNVARHANASRIKVYLREANSHLVMKVQDNGCGISQEKLLHCGNFGLLGMQERAWAMGGELELHASSRSGTTVTLRVPLVAKTVPAD